MIDILDYEGAKQQRLGYGYAAIDFRSSKEYKPVTFNPYALNSKGDGWFRKNNAHIPSDGYGICLVALKLTSSNYQYVGNYRVYKASMHYFGMYTEELVRDNVWLYVHFDVNPEEVIQYVKQHNSEWRA